jgi:hypothetical protein
VSLPFSLKYPFQIHAAGRSVAIWIMLSTTTGFAIAALLAFADPPSFYQRGMVYSAA